MTFTDPLVSVVMCVFNGRPYIEQAIADIRAQTYPNWEIIISDDASTDGTREWLRAMPPDDRIRIFYQDANLGQGLNKNFATAKARGQYITQQDVDDRTSPHRLERQVRALQASGLEIAACGFRRVNLAGETLFEVSTERDVIISGKGEDDYPFWYPALLVSRRVFDEIGLFPPYFAGGFGEDHYWTVVANEKFPILCLAEILYDYTDAPSSVTTGLSNPRKLLLIEVMRQVLEQRRATGTDDLEQGNFDKLRALEERLAADRNFMSRQYQTWAARSIDLGGYGEAAKLLGRAFMLAPWRLSLLGTARYLARKALYSKIRRPS